MKRGIDHLVLCVSDVDRAAACYEQMGFTVTPRAQHPWGTDNRLVQLDACFLELLTVARPEHIVESTPQQFSFGAFNRDFLQVREGMSMLVFETDDALADRASFIARGLPPYDSFHFERLAIQPDGQAATVGFTVAFATDERMPEAAFFCCQQHAPQYFWKPAYQTHANRARSIAEVIMLAPEPSLLADFFERLQEADSVQRVDGQLSIQTPRGRLSVLDPEQAEQGFGQLEMATSLASPRFLGFVIETLDLEVLAQHLQAAAIPFVRRATEIQIQPPDAFGALLIFRASTALT